MNWDTLQKQCDGLFPFFQRVHWELSLVQYTLTHLLTHSGFASSPHPCKDVGSCPYGFCGPSRFLSGTASLNFQSVSGSLHDVRRSCSWLLRRPREGGRCCSCRRRGPGERPSVLAWFHGSRTVRGPSGFITLAAILVAFLPAAPLS